MAQAKASLSELAARAAGGERFVLVRRGKPLACLVGPGDLERLEAAGRAQTFVEAVGAFRQKHRGSLPSRLVAARRTSRRPARLP